MPGVGEYVRLDESAMIAEYLPMAKRVVRRYFSLADGLLSYDDLDQEAAVALVEAIRIYDPSRHGPVASFAMQRVRWRVMDYVRRQLGRTSGRSRVSVAADDDEEQQEEDDSPVAQGRAEVATWALLDQRLASEPAPTEAAAIQSVLVKDLAAAIAELSVEDQQLLNLYWVHELTYEEIAQVLGSTKPTIGRRHQRVLRALAKALGVPEGGVDV